MCENCERAEIKWREDFDRVQEKTDIFMEKLLTRPRQRYWKARKSCKDKALKNCREPFKAGKGSSKTGAVK